MNPNVLFVIQAGKTHGTGHLKRCLQIAKLHANPLLLIYTDLKDSSPLSALAQGVEHKILPNKEPFFLEGRSFDLLVLDCAERFRAASQALALGIPSIVFDNKDLGLCADVFINTFPSREQRLANFSGYYYTPIRKDFFEGGGERRGVLISLGGSDPQKNAPKAVAAFRDSGEPVTLVKGPLSSYPETKTYEGLTILDAVEDLAPYIKKSRLVICGPGLTLLETLASQTPLVVIAHNPKQYATLKDAEDFETLRGGGLLSAQAIKKASARAEGGSIEMPEGFSFETWWKQTSESIRPALCPLCGSPQKKSLARTQSGGDFSCGVCGTDYYYPLSPAEASSNGEEFVANNPEQALKEYKDAILALKEESRRRIITIKKITLASANHKLLDIGAGEGVFIQEAMDNGIKGWGVELSEFARTRTKDLYNIEIFDSMDKAYAAAPYSIVTVWNRLHMLEDPLSVLRGFAELLSPGGVLAFRALERGQPPPAEGKFRMTAKGGALFAMRLGLKPAATVSVKEGGQKYMEIYCVRP